MTFSVELSWIPATAPYTITSKAAGDKLVKRLNRRIFKETRLLLLAKLDPHLSEFDEQKRTYSIEVVPMFGHFWETDWLDDPKEWGVLRAALTALFRIMKEEGLVPSVIERKGGEDVHFPGAGAHCHVGADLFTAGTDWYQLMERFHRNLATDLANRPYIRWLFKQWFADESGLVFASLEDYTYQSALAKSDPNYLFDRAVDGDCSIHPRFMATSKSSYLTFEHRQFSMVESPDEVRLIALVTDRWMQQISRRTVHGEPNVIPFMLTKQDLRDMGTIRGARRHCKGWIESLGLNWADYEPFFQRHYILRIKHGKLI